MFFTELSYTMNSVLNTIRSDDNDRFSAGVIHCRIRSVSCFTSTNLGAGFFANGVPSSRKLESLPSFRRDKWLVGFRVDVKSPLAKGFQFIKPVLLPFNLKCGDSQLQDIESERLFTVLVPSILQRMGVVSLVSKFIPMLRPSAPEINSAANVDSVCGNASDAVDARRGRDRRHQPTPLVSTLIGVLPGSQGHSSSQGFMRPSLGNSSILAFSARGLKVEEFTEEVV